MMFDLWPVYSGERFRASGPSCLSMALHINKPLMIHEHFHLKINTVVLPLIPASYNRLVVKFFSYMNNVHNSMIAVHSLSFLNRALIQSR